MSRRRRRMPFRHRFAHWLRVASTPGIATAEALVDLADRISPTDYPDEITDEEGRLVCTWCYQHTDIPRCGACGQYWPALSDHLTKMFTPPEETHHDQH